MKGGVWQILPVAKSGWFFWLCSAEHGSVFRFGGSHRWYLFLAREVRTIGNWPLLDVLGFWDKLLFGFLQMMLVLCARDEHKTWGEM
jgi:uncharacterized paraquat-inducible protein A